MVNALVALNGLQPISFIMEDKRKLNADEMMEISWPRWQSALFAADVFGYVKSE